MSNLNQYRERLIQALSPTHLELIDESAAHIGHAGASGGGHFKLVIASDAFQGKNLVQCHRLIYAALGDCVGKEIHALSIQIINV